MKIRILTESIKGLGLGHVARCYTLGLIFLEMGYEIDFFVRGNGEFLEFLQAQQNNTTLQHFYPLSITWENLANKDLVASDICIIDSYVVTDFSIFLTQTKVLVLFDDDGRHFTLLQKHLESCHNKAKLFLLNPNGFYQSKSFVTEHISKHIMTGLEYVMIHPCFHQALELLQKNLLQKEERKIIICFGGEDLQDISYEIFNILKDLDSLHCLNLHITVILGANYKGKLLSSSYLQCYQSCKNTEQRYNIYQNVPQALLAQYLAISTYSIVSGGGILFESILLAKQTFALELANNQKVQIQLLKEQGLVEKIPSLHCREFLEQQLLHRKKDSATKKTLHIGKNLKDFAAELVLDSLNISLQREHAVWKRKHRDFILDNYIAINFCNINRDEALRVLRYRNNPIVNQNMYGNENISEKTHFHFLHSLKTEEQSKYFLVQHHNTHTTQDIGVISLTRINLKHKNAYLGIYKNPEAHTNHKTHKLSYGSILMEIIKHIAFFEYGLHMLYLEVTARNVQAIRFYEKEGFTFMGELLDGFKQRNNLSQGFCNILIYGIKNPIAT
ncbi:UDP-4-amino-4,6-dideoxy-N-acetyl-beta-L-altrosamine N-acetyltransferase [Helicobacter aurati]|uniref:UDP-4-amino-4, 6-dideoxy-N-acetyl-beta-L-altrosamine N-acetyltransferase n=1 Tax=Helicobacter aurati TaxID=137778 RepID=A0A3D8J7J7_9HELI|nr:UDP-4-amino-4,6-dideoxy-N-acetyl-beta-L-altrosamine N-acetyltransferase [Helicobacter aurati]RDU73469.1 UDP-4-amino-4,6-dideoxy-N-acetyl-beta-L-altrosamine N-acetyltransferase [Helicobacter aurati]